jgi:hypothetical protein
MFWKFVFSMTGIGFRFNIAGEGQRTPDEATTFTFSCGQHCLVS